MKNSDQLFVKLLEVIENTENFINAETPEFIRQLLEYHIWECQFLIWFFIITAVIFIILFIVFYIINENTGSDYDVFLGVTGILSIFLIIINIIAIPVGLCEMKKIKIAPKVFIIDYLGSKINGAE